MAVTLKQTESVPEAYPEIDGLSEAATAILPAVWRRIEAYAAFRTTERDVSWIVEGCGEWMPPLTPAMIATVEIWQADAWTAVTLPPSPLGGYVLPGVGPYRFTGTAGDDDADVPPLLLEAVRRTVEYLAAKPGKPGVRSESVTAGTVSLSTTRSPTAMAEALQNSGAADLLRTYRRA
jgi:hypothetical protein